jgi:hypothetical protein
MADLLQVAVIIVYLAIIATLVASKQTSGIVNAIGSVFINSIKAAKG